MQQHCECGSCLFQRGTISNHCNHFCLVVIKGEKVRSWPVFDIFRTVKQRLQWDRDIQAKREIDLDVIGLTMKGNVVLPMSGISTTYMNPDIAFLRVGHKKRKLLNKMGHMFKNR